MQIQSWSTKTNIERNGWLHKRDTDTGECTDDKAGLRKSKKSKDREGQMRQGVTRIHTENVLC